MQPSARRLLLRLLLRPASSTPAAAQQQQQQQLVRQLAVAARDAAAQQPQLQLQAALLKQLHRHPWPLAPAISWHGPSCWRHHSSLSPAGGDGSGDGSGDAPRRGRDLAIVFTCGRCETRAAKTFSRQAYEAGVVLITCPGCQAMHLIADHLGWFGDSGFKIDEHLQQQGQQVKRVALDGSEEAAAELTAEDLAGWSKVQQLLTTVATAASGSDSQSSAGGGCSGGSSSQAASSPGDAAAGSAQSSPEGGSAAAAATEAAASQGVVQVAPGDVEAWLRVQQQQQQQRQQQDQGHTSQH